MEQGEKMSALLEVKSVTKKFGGLTANKDISFAVQEKEILSVVSRHFLR